MDSRIASAMPQVSRERIGHLAVGRDAPGPDRVVVVEKILTTHREQFGERRLHIAGLIDRTALDHGRLAVPPPGQTEACQGAGEQWLLQSRPPPTLALIDGHLDASDLAMPAPGDAGDLVKAGRIQALAARRTRDDRLRLHIEGKLPRRAV